MQNTRTAPAIELEKILFGWERRGKPILSIPALQLEQGGQIFIAGPSGSGKSTLLALIGGILTPQKGSIHVLGNPIHTMPGTRRDRFRVDHIGFIFQQFNLIPYLSILDNVLLPCRFSTRRRDGTAKQGKTPLAAAESLLHRLDLERALWSSQVTRLSVGQQQRVAAARALIGQPAIIVADEPTSALDADRQQAFLDVLQRECTEAGSSLVFVSHNESLGGQFPQRFTLSTSEQEGKI